ncbi:MAG TPA: lipoprotein-releasing ABC transporter permease subunit [Gammaproteobacteria bacterium]|nr:lipoprotein-releasing ABC transporter permease subunit [Gammaproteobacteria bacterium]
MFRPLAIWIGLRYTRAKRRNHFISFISLISIAGIALGVAALITVLSVMNGFEQELRSRILGMASHASISGYRGPLDDWPAVARTALAHPGVRGVAPFVRGEVMLSAGGRVSGAMLRGILPAREPAVSTVGEHMQTGTLSDLVPGEYRIILGSELAWSLGVAPGDQVTVVTPQANFSPAGILPRLRRFRVVGIFEVGMFEYDRGVALVHLDDAARLFRLREGQVSGVRLRLDDLFQAPRVASQLAAELGGDLNVTDWTRQHANFFRAVRTEKRVMFVILTLIVAVAAFNIVSTLVMVVTDKQADIAILRTLGATPGLILRIFMVQGTLIGILGTSLGLGGGIILALNVETIVPALEQTFGVQFMPADVYYISDLPSRIDWNDVWRIGAVAFLLSFLATLYPAWRASRTQPAEALRYE